MTEYKLLIGMKKSLKNMLVTYILPAILFLINNQTEWMPQTDALMIAPVLGYIGYFIKNYIENH